MLYQRNVAVTSRRFGLAGRLTLLLGSYCIFIALSGSHAFSRGEASRESTVNFLERFTPQAIERQPVYYPESFGSRSLGYCKVYYSMEHFSIKDSLVFVDLRRRSTGDCEKDTGDYYQPPVRGFSAVIDLRDVAISEGWTDNVVTVDSKNPIPTVRFRCVPDVNCVSMSGNRTVSVFTVGPLVSVEARARIYKALAHLKSMTGGRKDPF